MFRLHLSVSDTTRTTISIKKTTIIDDTKYNVLM